MRFLAGGPPIPDELLVARDEGRVVFFCGAGVSRARAGLPDFFGLAQNVISTLEGDSESPTKKLAEVAREVESRLNTGGLISADRVFGLLERDFQIRDIQAAIAKALKPQPSVDLSAHRLLLDLATGPDSKVRLVTTNFDLLFESCNGALRSWIPPRLPDPQRYEDMDGIIHLHGRVNDNYTGVEGDGFILSSSEFGRAYISQGWATGFISSVLERYFVVFVGYTADDPPVQYLLEALNRDLGSREGLYAFQVGSRSDAQSRWLHKGVQPIPYEGTGHHTALWDSLAAWANRARDPDAWYADVIAAARRGPDALAPHERGQVAHVVSTLEGARKFSSGDEPPPAEWLCVFDSLTRFSNPGRVFGGDEQKTFVDPFDAYGLDSDPAPRVEPDEHFAKRDVPPNTWNCFRLTRLDRQSLTSNHIAALNGHWATNVPRLPERLAQLGIWLSKISDQPAAVWWASGQAGIHPDTQFQIHVQLERARKASSPEVRKAWRYLFEAWETPKDQAHRDWFELKTSIALDGWTDAAIRHLASAHRPYLTAARPIGSGPRPPENKDGIRLHDMVRLDVEYPRLDIDMKLPDNHITATVRELRKNLELAVLLERGLSAYGLDQIASIEPDPEPEGEQHRRLHGISAEVLFYVALMKRLIAKDPESARRECAAWWGDDDTVFARLRIWACGDPQMFTGPEAGQLLCDLNDRVFWKHDHQRDLLLVLAKRWREFSADARAHLERRLLNGRLRWEKEEDAHYAERRAWASLERIQWLGAHGCEFGFDTDAETSRLRDHVPQWQPAFAEHAAESTEPKAGWVRTDSECAELLSVPLLNLLTRAQELSGQRDARFVQRDPFAGLVAARPIRALSALTHSAKRDAYPSWAWKTFLNSDARKQDKPRLHSLIAERVSKLPTLFAGELAYAVTEWMMKTSDGQLFKFPRQFEAVWAKLISALREHAESGSSSVIRQDREPEWATEALNAPAGRLAQVLMNDPQKTGLEAGKGFPSSWLRRVEDLLSLEGDAHRHALTILAYNLNWFFTIDPAWTETHLLSALNHEDADASAMWAGFLWAARIPSRPLYMRLKPALLRLERQGWVTRHSHLEVLAAIILAGWGNSDDATGERLIPNAEMRALLIAASDEFRAQLLWQLERWSGEKDENRKWAKQLTVFLADVWPRHKAARSSKTSARLCELAFSSVETFGETAEIITNLVIKIEHEHLMLHDLTKSPETIVDRYPEKTLALLSAVLSDDVSKWPYGIESVLERIGTADPALLKDGRLVELRRRWNAR